MKLLLLCISPLLCILVKVLYKLMGFYNKTSLLISFKMIFCVMHSNSDCLLNLVIGNL